MAFGFDEKGVRRIQEAVRRTIGGPSIGAQRRRQPPVLAGGGGAVTVIGPCASYTPDLGDPDTDFETAYPGGCDGPDVLGLNIADPFDETDVTIYRMELASTGPLVLESGTVVLDCKSGGTLSVYFRVTFNSLDVGGVYGECLRVSDDTLVQEYTNSMTAWIPLAAGNLQMGPTATTDCDCAPLGYNLCLSVPSR